MGDPLYSGDLFLEAGLTVKQEPPSMEPICSASASVPIPRRAGCAGLAGCPGLGINVNDFDTDFPQDSHSISGSAFSDSSTFLSPLSNSNPMWIDEEDIFKVVDKNDLIQGPTLAELNANETLWEGVDFDDLLIPGQDPTLMDTSHAGPKALSGSLSTATPSMPMTVGSSHGGLSVGGGGQAFAPCSFPPGGMGYKFQDPFLASASVPSSPMDPFTYSTSVGSTGGSYQATLSPTSQHSSNSSLLPQSVGSPVTPPPLSASPLQQKQSTLHELLLRRETFVVSPGERRQLGQLGQSVPGSSSPSASVSELLRASPNPTGSRRGFGAASSSISRLSSSAPTHSGLDHVWQRREPRPHLLSTGSLAEAGSTSSLSTGGVVSPESYDLSEFESDDSDHYEDVSSDGESSDGEPGSGHHRRSSTSKSERYFWQYNVQAKGPKGQRLVVKTPMEDPHHLNRVTDPVFSPLCSLQGIKHSGKARKGDGNDLNPNASKLYSIGKELDKLSAIINDMTPVAELPFNARPKTRKEKNKLASRACRLKKKAQHEANKIKLDGLEKEHKRLIIGIQQVRQALVLKSRANAADSQELSKRIEELIKNATRLSIAGETTSFVNTILENYKNGIPDGGLKDL